MKSWATSIADFRRQLTTDIETGLRRLIGFTLVSSSSSMGQDSVQIEDSDNTQRPVQRIEPYGFRGRPPAKVRGLWLRLGASNVAFIGILPTKAYGPDNLEEGETALYCSAGGTIVKLDKDGNIAINAASGKDVIVNGGTEKVSRVDDHGNVGSMVFAFGPGGAGATLSVTYTDPDGTVTTLPAGSGSVPLKAKLTEGADHFKG